MDLRSALQGAIVMGPMTKGSNLPYRRLCLELGARVTTSEMTVARRLKQKRRSEFALIRRAPEEICFGVQLAGNDPEEMAWATTLVASRGADFVDINLGCPIDYFTRKGLGAALARQPKRVQRIVAAMKAAAPVPVTVKIRLGWNDDHLNYLEVAQAAVDGGADGIFVHGRTRVARYRSSANWEAVGEVVRAHPGIPVVGNGDVLFAHEAEAFMSRSGCVGVMAARGVLIKPWIYREAKEGYRDLSAEERIAIYRRYVQLALEHWGDDERGRVQVIDFTRWHLGFWCRYAPRRADGSWPSMQERESPDFAHTPLEQLLARQDATAHGWLAARLVGGDEIDTAAAPEPAPEDERRETAQVSG